ncbi:hypothetical protein [Robiginitomaculum antarcticum]|uniref:hypothetical protein n=1 Tax=Robiginitomaculum antarcticum TaxID=437507 RepID=UPI00037CD806|nr:hypothetical protein [Robiginitomaculum antarcticum]
MKHIFSLFFSSFAALALAFVPMAYAQEDEETSSYSEWHTQDGKLTINVESSVRVRGGVQITSVEYMSADRLDGPGGVGFMCANGDFIALVSLEGRANTHKLITQSIGDDVGKTRRTKPKVTIGGQKRSHSVWMANLRHNVMLPLDPSLSKKIYNAAILGETVTIEDVRGVDDFTLHLPKPNQDFAYYGGGCGMGRNAGK